jgi:ABC-type phosphate transport system permease subunit
VARTTGFLTKDGERRFIIDQNIQLNLTTMTWYNKDDLGKWTCILMTFVVTICALVRRLVSN